MKDGERMICRDGERARAQGEKRLGAKQGRETFVLKVALKQASRPRWTLNDA
jgi:hypothetical protein